MSHTAPDLQINKLGLIYNSQQIFNNLDMRIVAGQWTCLLGTSGVGKSSLLKFLAGLIKSDKTQSMTGTVVASDNRSIADRISYMDQEDLLMPWLSALDNALLGYKLRGECDAAVKTRACELFAKVGLADNVVKLYPHELSGGMRQRVALVRTLLEDKPIVLMDEPFSALDVATRSELQFLAVELLRGRTVLLVTHDPLEALLLGNNIYVLTGSPAVLTAPIKLTTAIPRATNDDELLHAQAKLLELLTVGVVR